MRGELIGANRRKGEERHHRSASHLLTRACGAVAVVALAAGEVCATTPASPSGTVSVLHDPDYGNALGAPSFNPPGNPFAISLSPSNQINHTNTYGASNSSALGGFGYTSSSSTVGTQMRTGTAITQNNPSPHAYLNASALKFTFDFILDVPASGAFGANAFGNSIYAVGGTIGPQGSALFAATINFTNAAKTVTYRPVLTYSGTYNNATNSPVSFTDSFTDPQFLISSGTNKFIPASGTVRVYGNVLLRADNNDGPTSNVVTDGGEVNTLDSGVWAGPTGGNYQNSGNWAPNTFASGFPSGADTRAEFGSALTTASDVVLSNPLTVGAVSFDNINSYNISGSVQNSLTFATSKINPHADVLSGSHSISAPVIIKNGILQVNTAAGSALTMGQGVSARGAS